MCIGCVASKQRSQHEEEGSQPIELKIMQECVEITLQLAAITLGEELVCDRAAEKLNMPPADSNVIPGYSNTGRESLHLYRKKRAGTVVLDK